MMEEKEIEQKGFEELMAELKEIVESLEDKDIPLEKAISMFEEGMKISKRCSELLNQAEKRVKILLRDQETGEILEKDFEEEISP